MSDHMERLGRTIRAAESKGPARFVTGVTTTAPVARRISVQVAGAIIPAIIPGSFRGNLAAGQDVRLSVQGSTYTVDSILSALPTPAVAAPPSASGISPGMNGTASSGCYDAASGDAFSYARDVASVTRNLAGDLNAVRSDAAGIASDLASLQATVNGLQATVAGLRSAGVAQGTVA